MTFKLSKDQSAERIALAADLRTRAATLNVAIDAFNRGIEPLCRAVAEAQGGYNETLERARALVAGVAEPAQAQFDARSERWQDGETGTRVRSWIDAWEVCLPISISTCPNRWRNSTPTCTPTRSKTRPPRRKNWTLRSGGT